MSDRYDEVVARIVASPAYRAAFATPQDPRYHPEGTVGRHAELVLAAAEALAEANDLPEPARLVLAVVALTHDLGKTAAHAQCGGTTVHGHEAISARLLTAMLPALDLPADAAGTALDIVHLHDRGIGLYHCRPAPGEHAWQRLARHLHEPTLYAIFTLADRLGANGDLTVPVWLIGHLRAAGAAIPPIRLPDGSTG